MPIGKQASSAHRQKIVTQEKFDIKMLSNLFFWSTTILSIFCLIFLKIPYFIFLSHKPEFIDGKNSLWKWSPVVGKSSSALKF